MCGQARLGSAELCQCTQKAGVQDVRRTEVSKWVSTWKQHHGRPAEEDGGLPNTGRCVELTLVLAREVGIFPFCCPAFRTGNHIPPSCLGVISNCILRSLKELNALLTYSK